MDIIREIVNRLDRPVVMIGMMGAGKSRIGRLLAERLGLAFIDSDAEAERAAGCSVAEIFERFGEPAFRAAEEKIMRRLLEEDGKVISTGGGTMMNPATAQAVWDKGIGIWLRADLPLLLKRTAENADRPLLKTGDPEKILSELMELRNPVYAKAPVIVDSDDSPPAVTVGRVLEELYDHLR